MFAADPADAAPAAAALDEAVRWLDGALDPSGPYATGEAFSLADCALAPFALRLGVLGELCGYEPPADAARFAAWREACLARPSVRASMVPSDPKAYFAKARGPGER
jgi:glutathione S-transferase